MRSVRSVITPAAIVLSILTAKSYAQCDLECNPDGNATLKDANGDLMCVQGDADFEDHTLPSGLVLPFHVLKKSPGGYHCVCGPKTTGLKCLRKFEQCDADKRADNRCYHNGKCLNEAVDEFGNTKPFCDCSGAMTREAERHIGKYCEHPVKRCTEKKPFGNIYCLNDGDCKSDAETNADGPCKCKDGFFGPHCEIAEKANFEDCSLKCEHGGKCKRGFDGFDQAVLMFGQTGFFDEKKDYQYCECPDGYDGRFCEFKLTADGNRICGDLPCQRGGECVQKVDTDTGNIVRRCDCSNAKNKTHLFGGRYCQHASTSFCSLNQDQNGNPFCVNGGTCRDGGSHLGCDCPAGFTGAICDIVLDGSNETLIEVEEEAKCELDCGDGQCRKGIKDMSLLEGYGAELEHIANETNQNFQHCVCPPGMVGPRCEFKVEICGAGEHLCFHGSKCIDDKDGKTCDCDHTFNSLTVFAGAFCQHEASSFCTKSGNPATGGKASKAFCVNGGTCKGKIKDDDRNAEHPGCKCKSVFEGDHCEYRIGSEFNPNTSSGGSQGSSDDGELSTAGVVMISLASVAVVAAFAFFVFMKSKSRGKEAHFAEGKLGDPAPAPTTGPVLNMGPDKDADGNEVTDVEII